MDTVKFNQNKGVLMIAHRGVSGLERENTCPAFLVAGAKSYYGIETDVHVTADGEIIVFHDDSLKRLLDVDKRVEECTFSYLRSLRLKDFNGKVQQGLFLPTLEEYIDICKRYQKVAVLELKNPMQKQYIVKIILPPEFLKHITVYNNFPVLMWICTGKGNKKSRNFFRLAFSFLLPLVSCHHKIGRCFSLGYTLDGL